MRSANLSIRLWQDILALVFLALPLAAQTSIFQSQPVPLTQGMLGVAVSAESPSDVWVVGDSSLHFDGATWTQIPLAPVSGSLTLNSVVALSANNVWAVGFFQNSSGFDTQVVQHFDGTKWTRVRDLNLVGKTLNGALVLSDALVSITALSPTDIWACGYLLTQSGFTQALVPFVERFNGTKWSLSGVPAATGSDVMIGVNAISVISDTDAWMVAFQDVNGQDGQGEAFHFDGTRWKLFPTPAAASSTLRAVAAVASNDVWAVGDQSDLTRTLIEHFDGTKWTVVPSPTPQGVQIVELWGVAAISGTDVWATGFQELQSTGKNLPLVMHWDGAAWTIVSAPGQQGQSTTTFGVAALAPGNVWVAGTFLGGPGQPIFEPYVLFTNQGQ